MMKPQRFEIGQAVTKNKNVEWVTIRGVNEDYSKEPEFGKIYHIDRYYVYYNDEWFIVFREFLDGAAYKESSFDPVVTEAVLSKELESITKPVEV